MALNKLFENERILVEDNGSGEIFVTNKQDARIRLRITPAWDALVLTCHDGTLMPYMEGGLSAIRVVGGRPR